MRNSKVAIEQPPPDVQIEFLNGSRSLARDSAERKALERAHQQRGKAAGMDMKAWKQAVTDMQKGEIDTVISTIKNRLRYLQLMLIASAEPVSIVASDLFEAMPPHVSERARQGMDIWEAYNSGYHVGRQGGDREGSPYDAGSELHGEWMKAWQRGFDFRAQELGPNAEQLVVRHGPRRSRQARIPGTERARLAVVA